MTIHNLDERQIFRKVHSLMMVALRCKASSFGGRVLVEELLTPGLNNASTRFPREHLRACEHSTRSDLQAFRKLLIRQDACHGCVGNQHLWLPGVELFYNAF